MAAVRLPFTAPVITGLGVFLALCLILCPPVFRICQARTSLVSLPARDQVVVRLTGGHAALVQEKRTLSLKKGRNEIDFSWQNVAIDPDSILLEPVGGSTTLLSVSFPPGESALVWEVHSKADTSQPVVISYLLEGLDSLVTYEATADAGEKAIRLKSHLILRNFSGEDFAPATIWLNPATSFPTESRNFETRKILYFDKAGIPVTKVYTWDSAIMPHDPEKEKTAVGIPAGYKLENTTAGGLGFADLIHGKVRLYQEDLSQTTIFSGEDMARFVPRGDKLILETGKTRDVIVAKHRMDSERTHIRRNDSGKIQVYDEIVKARFTIENTKESPVVLTLKDYIEGQWEPVKMGAEYRKEDYRTLVFEIALAPGEKKTLDLAMTTKFSWIL